MLSESVTIGLVFANTVLLLIILIVLISRGNFHRQFEGLHKDDSYLLMTLYYDRPKQSMWIELARDVDDMSQGEWAQVSRIMNEWVTRMWTRI
jgi:hypothetical protein